MRTRGWFGTVAVVALVTGCSTTKEVEPELRQRMDVVEADTTAVLPVAYVSSGYGTCSLQGECGTPGTTVRLDPDSLVPDVLDAVVLCEEVAARLEREGWVVKEPCDLDELNGVATAPVSRTYAEGFSVDALIQTRVKGPSDPRGPGAILIVGYPGFGCTGGRSCYE